MDPLDDEAFTVAGLLRRHAGERPDAEMLVAGDVRRTWLEQYEHCCRVARALEREGVRKGDRVAFLDRNGLEYFDVLFGGALLCAVNVAVNWRLAPVEMGAVIDDSQAPVLVIHTDYLNALEGMTTGLPHVRRIVVIGAPRSGPAGADARLVPYGTWLGGADATDPGLRQVPEDVSMQLYTSGTTGLPKGVMLSNANLATAVRAAGEIFHIAEDTVSLVAMPLFHIGGSGWALCAMSRGGRSIVLRDVDPAEILRLIEAEGVTETFLVPAVLMFLLQSPAISTTDLSSLRNVFYGASPISDDVLVRCLDAFGCDFTQVYGLTETTGAITALGPSDHDPTGPRRHLLRSAGKPHEHVEIRIIDPSTGDEAKVGAVGEVVTRSALNMVGYWGRPEETANVLDDDGWFRTGDAGYLDEEGFLYLHDRMKDMIVTGGENVYPAEVENALLAHPGVADAAVIGVPDERWGEAVKAIVVPVLSAAPAFDADADAGADAGGDADADVGADAGGDTAPTAEELIAFCHERLAGYKCPKSVDFASMLPRNPSGKILKRELRAPYWAGRDRQIS